MIDKITETITSIGEVTDEIIEEELDEDEEDEEDN